MTPLTLNLRCPAVQRSSGPARIIIININPSSHLTGSMSRTSHLSPHHLKMGNVDKLVVLQQWHVVMLEETHCDESQHLDSERARHTWGVRPGSSTMFIRRPSVDQDGVHRQHFVWLLRWRPAPTSPGLAEKQREWKLNVVFLISISELWLRCRYFSIPRGLHNYRTEGKNIWFKINKGISLFGFLPQQLLPRILPVLMVNSKPEIRAKFDSPDFVENNEAMLREEFSKYFQVRNPVQPSYRRIVT